MKIIDVISQQSELNTLTVNDLHACDFIYIFGTIWVRFYPIIVSLGRGSDFYYSPISDSIINNCGYFYFNRSSNYDEIYVDLPLEGYLKMKVEQDG